MTGSGQLHEVSLKIGELLAKVETLNDTHVAASADRARMQSKMDLVMADVGQLKNDVAATKLDISEMKPSVQRYNSDRSRIMGGVAVVGSIFGAAASFGLAWLKKVFDV
ncbi:MAG TPA: DUF1515 family protein [Bosea sp. (in: a-proteobacteria)]